MIGYHDASSALILLVLLTGASLLHLSTPNPINTPEDVNKPHRDTPPGVMVSGDGQRMDEERRSLRKEEAEEEEELFKDVDPKTLASVLLEALNRSQVERRREGEEHDGMEEGMNAERGEVKKEETYREVRIMEGADRDRDGRQELELLMAAQGKERERQEEEERKKAQEEEERLTEKVTSRTTSQTVRVQTAQQPASPEGGGENGQGASPQQGPNSNEEEEQLSPEELKSLETMMKEFPRLNTATKREGDSEQNQRESRGYNSYNDIIPINKGSDLAISKKKLKWQEETQKALNTPTFRGGNFMDDSNYAGSNAAQSQPPAEQEVMEDDEPEEEDDEDEEVLSPEEEEARAKAEQEEMRRQAVEAQRAKMEEEKLADIASDMLLRYMVKQNNGNKKYSSSLSNAIEDKRSDEEQEVTEEDDIDPQTIDKLIEISSKLHLPADDVVDIISDVEKKKKKDVPPEMMSHWQQPLTPLSSSFSSPNGFPASPVSTNQNSFPISKQPSPAVNLLKTWFKEKSPKKTQDLWRKLEKPLLANQKVWPKPQKPLSIKQKLWLKSPKSVWTGNPFYPYTYPSYYQRRPYPDYHPIYFPPPQRHRPHYYVPKPTHTLNNFLGNSVDDPYTLPLRRRYHSWVQPRLRKAPATLQQKPYYTSYPVPLYPQTFQPVAIPKPRFPVRMPVIPPQQKQYYYSALAPAVTRNEDYYVAGKQPDSSKRDDLEKYIQQMLMKGPQILD
ncbi:neurosecretory protein VGF-like [Morone saxatilis]|uniref:neurosecretory protein VGF-like n=1 Tax=Morone saxatilis TaxID=34816 RepID=UPI0015E1D87D|nr:neurosecretory protein VGF-like [Morone saxatilis]